MNLSIRIGAASLAVLAILTLPLAAWAGDSNLRRAGSDAQFRVIDRFPDRNPISVEMPGVDPSSPFYTVVEAVRAEEWSTAWSRVNSEGAKAQLDAHPHKRFLAAYVGLRADEPEVALEHFDALDGELDALSDYIAYYSAQAALQAGDAHRATLSAAAVSSDSRLYDNALYLQAQALIEAGESADRERAAEVLSLYLSRYGSRNDAPRARLLLGDTLRSLDRINDAARAYLDLRDAHPLRAESAEAEERLAQITDDVTDRVRRRIAETDTPARTLSRYRGLYENHRSERVVDELPAHIDRYSRGSDERCEVIFMIAHSYTKLRRHGDGTPWYDRVLDECAGTSFEIRAMYLGGRGRWNAGDRAGAMKIFERIYTEYEDHSFADDAMYFTGRILRSEDRHDEARQILEKQVQRYPDGDMAKDAHWLLVRRYFDQADYDGAVDYVDGLDETGEDDLYTKGRLHYFRARALEKAGKTDLAKEGFEQVARDVPMSYYALLAINRLGRLGDGAGDDICAAIDLCDDLLPPNRDSESIDIPSRLSSDEAFERGALLLALGLTSHARAEFNALRNRHASSPQMLWALAMLLDRADAYPLSHDIARRHIDGWMNAYPDKSTRARWEVAYPTPFKEEVARHARQFGVDMAMIYAIMREESGFNPHVESWANARGLLQLIEGTADRMASRTNLSPYSFARLFEPDVNVQLGAAYMDYLGDRLDAHPALIMASYNAGSGVVTRWLGERGELPLDLFVEDIPYGQTRRYTKRVMMSFWIYNLLYGDQPVPYVAFELPN